MMVTSIRQNGTILGIMRTIGALSMEYVICPQGNYRPENSFLQDGYPDHALESTGLHDLTGM